MQMLAGDASASCTIVEGTSLISITNAVGQFHIQSIDTYGNTVIQPLLTGQSFSIALAASLWPPQPPAAPWWGW